MVIIKHKLVAVGTGRHVRVRSFTSILACPGYVRLRGDRGSTVLRSSRVEATGLDVLRASKPSNIGASRPGYDELAANYLAFVKRQVNRNLATLK